MEELEKEFGIPVISVLVDVPSNGLAYDHLDAALEFVPGYGREFMVYYEAVPYEGTERAYALTRLRTEIMAGKGPDVFLCAHDRDSVWGSDFNSTPFFPFPEKAMQNHVFLPLDDYIENAQYMEWDKLLPVVMEAGRNEEGQMLLPMAYYVYLTFIEKDLYTPTISFPCTWDEMTESDDPVILAAAHDRFPHVLGQLADFSTDSPLLSEEELLDRARKQLALLELERQGVFERLPEYRAGPLNRTKLQWEWETFWLNDDSPEYHMIPAYNIQGGVTADVTTFLAINRNTKYPELSFRMVDILMSKTIQRSSSLYRDGVQGMPVHMELGSKDSPINNDWYMSDANFQEFQTILSQINQVKFPGPADNAVWQIQWEERGLEKSVHKQYTLLQMVLAES